MPPRRNSAYTFSEGLRDEEGRLYLTEPEPFEYRDLPDNVFHPVADGDTLWGLASRYFPHFPRPAGLWWVIAGFQPEPVHDPTLKLVPGSVIVIPSERTLDELVFSERRRRVS